MIDLWNIISDTEEKYGIDANRCQEVIFRSKSIVGVKAYVDDVFQQLVENNLNILPEVWSVAIPLSYRLALDDVSANYSVASNLREKALRLEYPNIMDDLERAVSRLCKDAFGVSYQKIEEVKSEIHNELKLFTELDNKKLKVYGRRKSVGSLLFKLSNIYKGNKNTKYSNKKTAERHSLVFNYLSDVVNMGKSATNNSISKFEFDDLKWIMPDILAFTIQFSDKESSSKNLGTTKAIYKGLINRFIKTFPYEIYFGPSFSENWHMNRLVSYVKYSKDCIAVPMELFIRTDFDYFIGFGNYWRYKDVNLFQSSSLENNKYRRNFTNRVRACNSFSEVQEIILNEITTGQLDLF